MDNFALRRGCVRKSAERGQSASLSGPTGIRVEVPYAAVYTVHDDRIVSWRMYWDQIAVMGQLGLLEQ